MVAWFGTLESPIINECPNINSLGFGLVQKKKKIGKKKKKKNYTLFINFCNNSYLFFCCGSNIILAHSITLIYYFITKYHKFIHLYKILSNDCKLGLIEIKGKIWEFELWS